MSQPPAGSSARKPAVLFVYRERYLGVKIPPTDIQDHHLEAARKFADGLADRLASLASGNTIDQGASDCADVHIATDACVAER